MTQGRLSDETLILSHDKTKRDKILTELSGLIERLMLDRCSLTTHFEAKQMLLISVRRHAT